MEVTCSRVPSNHSIMFSMLAPASRFSKTVATGIRVPRKAQAPLTLPGTLSTAGHCDQSIGAIVNLRLAILAQSQGGRVAARPIYASSAWEGPALGQT